MGKNKDKKKVVRKWFVSSAGALLVLFVIFTWVTVHNSGWKATFLSQSNYAAGMSFTALMIIIVTYIIGKVNKKW